MKKILLALTLSLCTINAYELNFNKIFSLDISPEILTSHISINYENKEESIINEKLEEFNSFFKEQDDISAKNGRFNLNPRYRYQNGKQKFLGYRGSLNYTIESKDAKKLNNFLSELIILKKEISAYTLKLSIGNISWKISKKQREFHIDNLRKNAIEWIKDYKQTISSSCLIKQINIGKAKNFHNQPIYSTRTNSSVPSISTKISPISSSKNITLHVNYSLECK